jgi:LysM repeat protein
LLTDGSVRLRPFGAHPQVSCFCPHLIKTDFKESMMLVKRIVLSAALLAVMGSAQAWKQDLVEYTWAENDDIETVAGNYDVSAEQILVSNGWDTDEITVGTVVYIPPKHATGYFNPETGVYTIAPGDDLLEISRRFGTSVEAIQNENDLTGTEIVAGQTLLIP